MIVGHAKEGITVAKYCTDICAAARNSDFMTYNYTESGVAKSGLLEPGACATVCADIGSISFSNGTGTVSILGLCPNGISDCASEAPGDGDSPPPITPTPTPTATPVPTYTVTWSLSDLMPNSYFGTSGYTDSTANSTISTTVTSGSTATVTVYLVPNSGYAYTSTNQATVTVNSGTSTLVDVVSGGIKVTLTRTNVISNTNITATGRDANGGPSTSGGSGSGSGGGTPTPTPTAVSYKYVVECVSGACNQGTGRVVSHNQSLSTGTLVTINSDAGCWELLSTTTATPTSYITGLCAAPTPTPTPVPEFRYTFDPCDGVSPYVVAKSTTQLTINQVYDLSGSLYADQAYTCIASTTNPWETTVLSPSSCAGEPTSCLLEGTQVEMHDGSIKNIEDLIVGDTLMSSYIDGMPDSDNIEVLREWSSPTISTLAVLAQISAIHEYERRSIVYINGGLLYATADHQHVIKSDGNWTVRTTENIKVGDSLIDKDGNEVEVRSLMTVYGRFKVYKLDVEENDTFIANGIITHNGKGV